MSPRMDKQFIARNTFTRNREKIPMSLLIFSLTLQICFGIDFGFGKILKKKLWMLPMLVTVLMSIVYMTLLFAPLILYSIEEYLIWSHFIEYFALFVILKRVKYNLYDLVLDVKKIPVAKERFFPIIVIVYPIFIASVKTLFNYLQCIYDPNVFCHVFDNTYFVLYNFPCFALDQICVVQIVIFYYIYLCTKNLIITINKKDMDLQMLVKCYMALTTCVDKIRPLYDSLVILQLAKVVPKIFDSVFATLLYIRNKKPWYMYAANLVNAFHCGLQVFLPAAMVELMNSRVRAIKLELHEKLMTDIDDDKKTKIIDILRYLEARQIGYLVLRFIPVDLQLVLSLFSLCSTYFIIFLQFVHIFD